MNQQIPGWVRNQVLEELRANKPVGTTFVLMEGGELRDVTASIEEARDRADQVFDLLCDVQEFLRAAEMDTSEQSPLGDLMRRIEDVTGVMFCEVCDDRLGKDTIIVAGRMFCTQECLDEWTEDHSDHS